MIVLAFETSCDETSVAVLDNGKVKSNIIASQLFHSEFGGVVPEIASREHLKKIVGITEEALRKSGKSLSEIELIAATSEPGLIGALLIGLNFAKSLAASLNLPIVAVNHIQAHVYSTFINQYKPEFPFISLIVSGGHTLLISVINYFDHKILGSTVDDAAGEAFDKVAKLLKLGYPGGPIIDELAAKGNSGFHKFPLANVKNYPFNFSFSGIKTSVLYYLRDIDFENNRCDKLVNDICASFQFAVIESLYRKTLKAAQKYDIKNISVSGGVSANSCLQKKFLSLKEKGYKVFFPGFEYSTDNAAMIGLVGMLKYKLSINKKYFTHESFNEKAKPRLDYKNF
jgi:N6-L-threonylcarbamoyladenine synthase